MKYEINSHLFSKKLSSWLIKKGLKDKKGEPDKIALYNLLYPANVITEEIVRLTGRQLRIKHVILVIG